MTFSVATYGAECWEVKEVFRKWKICALNKNETGGAEQPTWFVLPPPPKVEGGYVFTPVCLSVSVCVCVCARYLNKLWMDSDEICWQVGCVTRSN